ncbi:MAG: PqqD family protein [Myxococcales bacterium]|nr:PqqD family protein [Myxococcales bacterium]
MSRLRVRAGLTIRELPDGDAVVARDDGAEAVIINATASAVLELFGKESSEEEVARVFCESFPGEDVTAIRRDVHEIVQRLITSGILEPCGSASSTV